MSETTVSPEGDTAEEPVCPECRDGKHFNCTTGAWDDFTDTPTYCRCWQRGHEE
jgi:hypothetical protein